MHTDIFKQASDMVNACEVGSFSALDENGYPNVATRSRVKSNGIMEIYFSTDTSGNMANSILRNAKSSVCFRTDGDNISLVGKSEIVTDMAVKKNLWLDWFINHFSGGVEDPEYCVIKFTTERVSMWVDRKVYKFSIDEITEITSRCGLMCNSCDFKEPNNCKGCIASNGNPFYGKCPIAHCAQEKGLLHCGQCDEMPCDNLRDYSCGDSEHSDHPKGARLDVLRMWAR